MPDDGTPKPRRSLDPLARLFTSASDSVVVVSSILVVIVINGGAKGKSNEAGFSLCSWDSLQKYIKKQNHITYYSLPERVNNSVKQFFFTFFVAFYSMNTRYLSQQCNHSQSEEVAILDLN